MTEPAVLAALVAVCASLLAISGRDTRIVVGGLFVTMIAAPLAASPEPSILTIAFRVVGALLAAYLLWMAARTESMASDGSGIGIGAEAVIAAAAFVVGWFVVPVKPLAGPVAAQAGAFSLAALAIVPLTGRNVMRAGAAAAILVLSFSMLLVAWVGPISALEQLVLMVLVVGIVGAAGLLSSSEGSAPEAATLPPEGDGTAESTETDSTEPGEPLIDEPASTDHAPEPAAAPESAAATLRTSRSRSPRAVRRTAPIARPEPAVEPEDLPEAAAAPPATPRTTRVRLIRPREPRQ
jgi:hypothetical protein